MRRGQLKPPPEKSCFSHVLAEDERGTTGEHARAGRCSPTFWKRASVVGLLDARSYKRDIADSRNRRGQHMWSTDSQSHLFERINEKNPHVRVWANGRDLMPFLDSMREARAAVPYKAKQSRTDTEIVFFARVVMTTYVVIFKGMVAYKMHRNTLAAALIASCYYTRHCVRLGRIPVTPCYLDCRPCWIPLLPLVVDLFAFWDTNVLHSVTHSR